MGGSTLIRIAKNDKGWYYKKNERVGYYSSLAEVMVDAYREECPTPNNGTAEQRNS